MRSPRNWTTAELAQDAEQAVAVFRRQRLQEPLELYSQFFESFAPVFADVIARLPRLARDPFDPAVVSDLVADKNVRTAFRYLAAPPISEDDLKTLAETTLSAARLRSEPTQAERVRNIILQIIDPHRFPWIAENRNPTEDERVRAVVASAALVAVRKVETARRSDARKVQEAAVKALLRGIGFVEVPTRDIRILDDSLAPRQFCGESKLGDTRADLVVRLDDRRVMPIECKASNSAVNSFKRINHEAAGKARDWLAGFGRRQTIPVAVISGVFNAANLATAQSEGLAIIWSHRLDDLAEFVESCQA